MTGLALFSPKTPWAHWSWRKGAWTLVRGLSCRSILTSPGRAEEFRRVEGAYFVCIDPTLARDVALALFNRRDVVFPNRIVGLNPEIRALLFTFISEASRGPAASRFLLDCCGSALPGHLVRAAASQLMGMDEAPPRRANIRNAIDYLNDHFRDYCRLEDVANAANLSAFHLIRVFKSETGKTPHEYLVDVRMAKAKQMLADRRFSIKEIAFQCGFKEPGSLSRVFQRRMGRSPRAYRKTSLTF